MVAATRSENGTSKRTEKAGDGSIERIPVVVRVFLCAQALLKADRTGRKSPWNSLEHCPQVDLALRAREPERAK